MRVALTGPVKTAGLRTGRGRAVTDNVELVVRIHPVGGEDVSLIAADFRREAAALEEIARALDERRSLVLTRARYNREAGESGVIVNLANPGAAVRPGRQTGTGLVPP
jgi:hypothetical protein